METILFLAHVEPGGALARIALETLESARRLSTELAGAPLVVGLIGPEIRPAADRLAGCGASRFLGVSGAGFAQPRYASDAAAAEAIAKAAAATIVIAPATSRWNRVLAAVAHRLGGRIDTHVTAMSGSGGNLAATRWYYRQRMEAEVHRATRPWIVALESGASHAWEGPTGTAALEDVSVVLTDADRRTTVTGVRAPATDEQTIRPEAKLLFVTGAGWTKKQPDGQVHTAEAGQIILNFLRHANASLGSTKSLVDLGGEGQEVLPFLTHLNQVGQTGSTPRHPKGLATCCHGEEPHTVGWRFIGERRAINLNPACSWAQGKADVLYVADAFEVMRQVNALLAGGR